jgi:hypothetical protein
MPRSMHAEHVVAVKLGNSSQRRCSILEPWSGYRGSLFARRQPPELFCDFDRPSKAASNRASHGFIKLQRNTATFPAPTASTSCSRMRRWSDYQLGTPRLGA